MVERVDEAERPLDAALLPELVREAAREIVLVEAALLAAVVEGKAVAGVPDLVVGAPCSGGSV
jgi:hypothetical protein